MRFLIDAQLPARLATLRNDAGHDAVHTTSLPNGNRSTDREIADMADIEGRIVVSKDRDFRDSHLLSGVPQHLLVIATGNVRNTDLLHLFESSLPAISQAFADADYVELRRDSVVAHPRPVL